MIDKKSSPVCELEKTIANWALKIMKGYKYTVNSSLEFLNKLLKVGPLPKEVYTVMDYTSLYPSIQQAPSGLMLYRFIIENLPYSESHYGLIRDICHIIIYSSYFIFQGKYYLQNTGVPIGGLLAGVMAELVIRYKERSVLIHFKSDLKMYIRYIDNICVI